MIEAGAIGEAGQAVGADLGHQLFVLGVEFWLLLGASMRSTRVDSPRRGWRADRSRDPWDFKERRLFAAWRRWCEDGVAIEGVKRTDRCKLAAVR